MEIKKKKTTQVNEENAIVREMNTEDWVKNPVAYAQIRGDFSLMESNIMVNLVNALQPRVNAFLKKKQMGMATETSLFTPEELNKGEIKFEIPLSDLEIRPDAYDELDRTCEKMISVAATYEKTDEETGEESIVHANIFSKIELPKSGEKADKSEYKYKNGRRRKGVVRVYMLANNVDQLFNMKLGYVEHLRRIVPLCRRQRTPRLYIYLSKYKDVGHKLVDYNELKEYLGILTWDKERRQIKEDKYAKFSVFCKNVLDPIKEEMDALVANNTIDITFNYEPRYQGLRKRGNPDQVYFEVLLSDMGKQRSKKSQKNQTNSRYQQILINEYGLSKSDVKRLYDDITDDILPQVEKEIMELKAKVDRYHPRSIKAYVIQLLKNHIDSLRANYAEILSETPNSKVKEPPVMLYNEQDQKDFELFKELAAGAIPQQEYNTWIAYLELYEVKGNHITVIVPNEFFMNYIDKNLIPKLRNSFIAAFGDKAKLQYKVKQ